MDRRQKKTREAIFKAFSYLIQKKSFSNITVQEIIDEANIGRSTFYAHFSTKDALLHALCKDIFDHVFSESLSQEHSHDFSEDEPSLRTRLVHTYYHIKDSQRDISGILSGESCDLFMAYFRSYLVELFKKGWDELNPNVPRDFALNQLSAGFAESIRWWLAEDAQMSPEEIADNFLNLYAPNLSHANKRPTA